MDNNTLHWIHDPPGCMDEACPDTTADCSTVNLLQNNFDGPTAFHFVEQINCMKNFLGADQAELLAHCFCQLGSEGIGKIFGDNDLESTCRNAFVNPFGGSSRDVTLQNITPISSPELAGSPEEQRACSHTDSRPRSGSNDENDYPHPSHARSLSKNKVRKENAQLKPMQEEIRCTQDGCQRKYIKERFLREHLTLKHEYSKTQARFEASAAFTNAKEPPPARYPYPQSSTISSDWYSQERTHYVDQQPSLEYPDQAFQGHFMATDYGSSSVSTLRPGYGPAYFAGSTYVSSTSPNIGNDVPFPKPN